MTKYIKIVKDKEDNGNNGTFYYKDKKMTILHREDGPAIEFSDGSKSWFKDGKLHREDGPAIYTYDGGESYYLNDAWYTKAAWTKAVFKVVELTLEDIAKLAGVSVEKIKIVQQKS